MNDINDVKEPHIPRSWHVAYIEAQADPMDSRNDTQFCEAIGLEYKTFQAWKGKYRTYIFQEVEKKRKTYVNELRAKGHKALAKKLDKDTNAIKLLFQLLGDLVEKTEVKTEMNKDDTIRRIKTLTDSLGKRQREWEVADVLPKNDQEIPPKP